MVEAGFYSDVLECLPVDPATWDRFLAEAGKLFSLYNIESAQLQYVDNQYAKFE